MKLEVGRFYRTRDGRRAGPLRKGSGEEGGAFSYDVEGSLNNPFDCCEDGKYYISSRQCELDLVAEWVEEKPEELPTACPDPDHLCEAEIVARFNDLVEAGRVQYSHAPKYPSSPWYDANGQLTVQLKPAEPRRLKLPDSGYECVELDKADWVRADAPTVKIGCQAFAVNLLKQSLRDLTTTDKSQSGEFHAHRNGIRWKQYGLTYHDADALLAFLEEK